MSRRISRGRRAHLLALWTPRARAQEQREADRAVREAWRQYFAACDHAVALAVIPCAP